MSLAEPLPANDPTRPLIAWALELLALDGQQACDHIRSRLMLLVPDPPEVDPKALLFLHLTREQLLDVPAVVTHIMNFGRFAELDPDGWGSIAFPSVVPAIAPEDLPWRRREQIRFIIEHYERVPWADELAAIPDHYAHLSTDKPGLIAYTQDAAKGAADIQTQIRPGRYLSRFYPQLADADVRRLVNGVARPAELVFAHTADEIEKVYLEGPTSCMSRAASEYDSPCHPVRVYGDSDLALAYAVPADRTPTARALVWPAQKRFGRIYGDDVLLQRLLGEAGYAKGSLTGARIRRIAATEDDDAQIVMPYLDDARTFGIIDDLWLCIGGPYAATNTNGVALLEDRPKCDYCDEHCEELFDVGSDAWCDNCREHNAFCSDLSGDYSHINDECEIVVRRKNGVNHCAIWAEHERDEHATYCDGTQEYYQTARFTFIKLKNGETWESSYFEEHGDPDDVDAPDTPPAADNDNMAAEDGVAA